jgi:exopolysaccharide biosynthesis polyprenyl glycosylphosphotransferase
MSFFRRQILLYFFTIFDLLVVIFSFVTAMAVSSLHAQREFPLIRIFSGDISLKKLALFLGFLLMWRIIFTLFGLYRSMRFSSRWVEIGNVLKATSLGTLIMVCVGVFLRMEMITSIFVGVFWGVSNATSLLGRFFMRFLLAQMRRYGRNLRFMLIVGTNERAMRFVERIASRKELGYRIIGFVDDDWKGMREFQESGYHLVSGFSDFSSFLRSNVVDEVVICLSMKSFYDRIASIVNVCEEQGILVRILIDLFELKFSRVTVESFGKETLVLRTGRQEGWQVLVKQILDRSISLFLLILLSPLFLVVAILIKVTCPGPIFFAQRRVGFNKRIFDLYKFRTMVVDAEERIKEVEFMNEAEGPVFKIRNDPRVTPIGKLLRKSSIDELPQLFNVLKGDMSLVGPRPLPVRDYNGFYQDWHRRRFSVRPGITCLWQINGRHTISFENWMKLDMEYIDQWSLWLDMKILAKTVSAVVRMSGS